MGNISIEDSQQCSQSLSTVPCQSLPPLSLQLKNINMNAFIDIEGFKDFGNEFIVKEFAMSVQSLDSSGNCPLDFILVDPPHKWDDLPSKYKEMNQWLTRHYHGLHWDTPGDIEHAGLKVFVNELVKNVDHIYVRGLDKKRWVELILVRDIPVVDLDDLGCPVLEYLEVEDECVYHQSLFEGATTQYHCAIANVQRLRKSFAKYDAGSLEKSLKKYCEKQHLNALTSQEISFLPKHFIKTIAKDTVDAAWDKLPEAMKMDGSIAGLRFCRMHWSSLNPNSRDPLPTPIVSCALCQYQRS